MSPPWNERPIPYVGIADEASFRPLARHKLAYLHEAAALFGESR